MGPLTHQDLGAETPTVAVTCITANLARRSAALERLMALGADVLFVQEAPRDLTNDLTDEYTVAEYRATGTRPGYLCRSLVGVRRSSNLAIRGIAGRNAGYHRSYVAFASIDLPEIGATTVASVHASPSQVGARSPYLRDWNSALPDPRRASDGELWDADFLLATLAALRTARSGPLLVAGDLNEARTGTSYGPDWAIEWFARARAAGLIDVTMKRWHEERATHRRAQVDHVLATADVAARISDACVAGDIGSDHLPIRFTIG